MGGLKYYTISVSRTFPIPDDQKAYWTFLLIEIRWYHPIVGMKNMRVSDALDRSAASDLWRNTLSQIPSLFGRLVYLASLRNANSGRYEHHGLTLVFGEEDANRALKKSHTHVFREWLRFNLEQQKADLDLYLAGLCEDKRTILTNWLELAYYRNLMPVSLRGVEKRLYTADLKALLELMGNAYAAAAPGPDA
ncbi:MAG TPA: hypothetical protein VK776_12415 [Bryobacteraceae bacterium]|nr:hypothetical protein [Bryobacteraceae bacterium]